MMKRILSALLCTLMLLTAVSCGEAANDAPAVTAAPSADGGSVTEAETEPEETVAPYTYALDDFDGYAFTYLNEDYTDWANPLIAPDEANGETINDALYERKLRVEEDLNVSITEEKVAGDQLVSMTKKLVTAGDDVYDVISNRSDQVASILTGGYLVDMESIDSMNFDEEWWDTVVIQGARLNGKLYFATSDISLFAFEATWVVYFNESMMANFGIDFPYDSVREGTWTLDALNRMLEAGTTVTENVYDIDKYTYGMITHSQFYDCCIAGGGIDFVTLDDAGMPVINTCDERFYTLCDKIAAITAPYGRLIERDSITLHNDTNSGTLEFMTGAWLALSETLGHIADLRNFDDAFGIVPIPKYDENQDGYRSMIATWGVEMTTIPATNTALERTGLILDYLAYQSRISLMEPYYNTYLTQKGVRNEESAEMLSIISATRCLNTGILFGWTSNLASAFRTKLGKGDSDLASTVATYEPKFQASIDKTIATLEANT